MENNTIGNAVVQDPTKVGTALKTLSLRLTKTKAEIEELGEDSDGAASSVSELRDTLLALTNQKVDILDGDSYKSTYDILKEMAGVWDDMSQMNRQGALFAMAGMNHANTLASIITNFKDVEAAYEVSLNESFGSADKENAKFLNSVEGRMQQFQSSMQKLSSHTFSSDFLKGFISAGQGVVDILDKMAQSGTLIPGIIGAISAALGSFKNIGFFQLRDWSKGFFSQDATGKNKFNWSNIELFGSGRVWGEKKTAQNYNNILSSAFSNSTQPFKAKMSYSQDDANFLRALNDNLAKAQNSSKSFGEVFGKAVNNAQKETGHLSSQIVTLTANMNDLKGNKNTAMKDMGKLSLVQDGAAKQASQMGSSFGKNLLTGFISGLGNMAMGMGISALIQGAITGIDYLVHYSENKIAEGQAVVDKYNDAMDAARSQKEKLEGFKPEFTSLSAGVDDLGHNISLSTEEYDRYKQIISEIVGVSPSLIASYDAEGNALANKNQLIERAIELEEKKMELAEHERLLEENSKTEYEGYQNQLKQAKDDLKQATYDFDDALNSPLKKLAEQFRGDASKYLVPELEKIFNERISMGDTFELDDASIEAIRKELELLDNLSLDPDINIDRSMVQELRNAFEYMLSMKEQADLIDDKAGDGLALAAAHATEAYKNASEAQQSYIDKAVAGLAVVSKFDSETMKGMGVNVAEALASPDFNDVFTNLDKLTEKFNTGDISAAEFGSNIEEIVSRMRSVFEGLGLEVKTEDIWKALGIEEIMVSYEAMMKRVGALSERYKGKLNLSQLTDISDIRVVTDAIGKIEAAFGGTVPDTLLKSISQQIRGSKENLHEVMEAYNSLADMAIEGNWSQLDISRAFASLEGLDVSEMKQYVDGFSALNDMIEALNLNMSNAEDKNTFSNILSSFIDGNYSGAIGKLNEEFQRGRVDAAAYDAQITTIMRDLTSSAGIAFDDNLHTFEDFIANFTKSINTDQLLSSIREAKEAVDDFFNADYALRPFLTDSLSGVSEQLETIKNQAKAAHDVQAFFDASMASDYVSRVSQISSDPYERLSSAIQTATSAMQEQNATGRVSYETFKNLQALGPDYANTLKATSGQLLLNRNALLDVVDAEKKQSEAMLSNLQNGALQRYAEKTNEIAELRRKLAQEGLTPQETTDLSRLEQERQDMLWLADSYKTAKTALNELTGARAQLDSFLGQTSAADDFTNSWGKGLQDKLKEYASDGQWGEVKKGLATVFQDVPSDIPGLKALMAKLKSYGTEAKTIVANIGLEIAQFLNGDQWTGLSYIDLDTGKFMIFEEELEAIANATGFTVDYIAQAIQSLSSYDTTFDFSNIDQYIERLHSLDGALDDTNMVANIDRIREALSSTMDSSDINSLIAALQEAGYTLQNDAGEAVNLTEELTKLSNIDGFDSEKFNVDIDFSGAAQAGATLSLASQNVERFAGAISEVEGTKRVEITGLTSSAEGAKLARTEIASLVGSFDHDGYDLTINGEVVGLEEALTYLDELGVTYGDVRQQILETPIDISTPEGLEEFANSIGQTTEGMEGFEQVAERLGDTEVTAKFKSEGDIENVQSVLQQCAGDAEALQGALDNLSGTAMPGNAWGIADTSGVFDEVSGKIDEVQGKLDTLGQTEISIDLSGVISGLDGVASSATKAASSVRTLQSAIGKLPTSKTITITTNYKTTGTPPKTSGGHAAGTSYSKPGTFLVNDGSPVNGSAAELIIRKNGGEAFIANGGKLAMVQLNAGDKVLNAAQTQATLREQDIKIPRMWSGGNIFAGTGGGKTKPTTSTSSSSSNRGSSSSSSSSSRSSSSSSSSGVSASQAKSDAKDATDAIKEEFQKLYKELQYLRDKDVIDSAEYYRRLNQLVQQYLAGNEELLEEFWQYDAEVYKGMKQEQEKTWQEAFNSLKHQLDMHLITEEQYYSELNRLNQEFYAGKEEYLSEFRANEVAIHNFQRQQEEKLLKDIEHQYAMGELNDAEYWNARREHAYKYYKDVIGQEENWQQFLEDEYKHIKEERKNQFEQLTETIDMHVEMGLISTEEGFRQKEQAIANAYGQGTITQKEAESLRYELQKAAKDYANDQVDRAVNYLTTQVDRRIDKINRDTEAQTRPIDLAIRAKEDLVYDIQEKLDNYNFLVELSLRPLEDEKYELEQTIEKINREYELKTRPLQKELKAKQREQADVQNEQELTLRPIQKELDSLQRQSDIMSHEYGEKLKPLQDLQKAWQRQQSLIQHEQELAMRPIDKEINALNREITHINRYYEMLMRPLKDFQYEQQKELELLQRQQELAMRPIEKQLNVLSRESTHVNRDYELRLRPLQEQLELLQDAQDAAQDTYDIEEKRYNLTKAQTERNRLVYKEGLGFVYEYNREAVKQAENAFTSSADQSQINELQKQIKQIERERDKILEGIEDQEYELNEQKLDLQEYYENLIEPLQDTLYDLGKVIEMYERMNELDTRPIEDRLYDLNETRLDLAEYYEAQLETISDSLFDLQLLIEDIETERDNYLYELEDKIFHLTQKRIDIELAYEERLFDLSQSIFQLTRDIEMLDTEKEEMLEGYEDRLYDINQKMETINRTSELYNRQKTDEIKLHQMAIQKMEREKELIERNAEDQIFALNQIKDILGEMVDPVEEAKNRMAAMAVYGESLHDFLGMINSDDLPGMVEQAKTLCGFMVQTAESMKEAFNVDPSKFDISNWTGVMGNVNSFLGTGGTINLNPTELEGFLERLTAVVNSGYGSGDKWYNGINIKTSQMFGDLYEKYKRNEQGSAENLKNFMDTVRPILVAMEAYMKNPNTSVRPDFSSNTPVTGSSGSTSGIKYPTNFGNGGSSTSSGSTPSSGSSAGNSNTNGSSSGITIDGNNNVVIGGNGNVVDDTLVSQANAYLKQLMSLRDIYYQRGDAENAELHQKWVNELNSLVLRYQKNGDATSVMLMRNYMDKLSSTLGYYTDGSDSSGSNQSASGVNNEQLIQEAITKLALAERVYEIAKKAHSEEETAKFQSYVETLKKYLESLRGGDYSSRDHLVYVLSELAKDLKTYENILNNSPTTSRPTTSTTTPTTPETKPSTNEKPNYTIEVKPNITVTEPTDNGASANDKPSGNNNIDWTPSQTPEDYFGDDQPDVTIEKVDPAVLDAFQQRLVKAYAEGFKGQPGAELNVGIYTKLMKLIDAIRNNDYKSNSDWKYNFYLYDAILPHYASGRKTGRSELAITQESGAELLAAKSGGRYTLLNAGDMVFSNAQTKRLWELSKVDATALISTALGAPKVQAHSTEVSNCTVNIGDVVVQHADNPDALSKAIINRLPNQLLQDLKGR